MKIQQLDHASVAVVDDDPILRSCLVDFMHFKGYSVQGFENADSFFQVWRSHPFDLAILDVVMPGTGGIDVAKRLREDSKVGIVMLSALGGGSDVIHGLEAGADAYLVKSAPMEVIEATCRSVLRRRAIDMEDGHSMPDPTSRECAWCLDLRLWQLTPPYGEAVELTHTEAVFLKSLIQNSGTPVRRDVLLTAMGKVDTLANLRNLDNCASRLRRKVLKAQAQEIPVRPSYNSGYTFLGKGLIVEG